MKFFEIVWKEISLVKSQKIALLLIILYPFLVIGLLGSAFTGMDVSKMTGTKIGIVNALDFNSDITGKFSSMKELRITPYPDINSLTDAIKKKEITAGIRLLGSSANSQIKVELFYDNSSLLSSRFFIEIAKAMMQRVTSEAVQTQLSGVLQTVSSLGKNLESELKNISDFKAKLASAEISLNNLETKVNALDFNAVESELNSQKTNVDSFNSKNTNFKNDIASFQSSFNEFKTEYSSLKTLLTKNQTALRALPAQIGAAYYSIEQVISNLESIKATLPTEEAKTQMNDQIIQLNAIKSNMSDWNALASDLIVLTNKIVDDSSSLNQTISKADSMFARVNAESQNVSTVLSSSSASITEMNSKLMVFKESITEVKDLIIEARKSKKEIEEKLNASDSLLSEFSSKILNMKDLDPKVLSQPVLFYEVRMYNVDPFGILVANSAVVVLILTCMLLTSILVLLEKNQNVSLRLSLSNTSRFTLLFGKMTGQLVIALVEAVIIFMVAFTKIILPFPILGFNSIGFGLVTNCSLLDLFLGIVIISIAFISMGILISFFTKNQSTAILTSLLLVVPMLFLSGIILPIDFMEPFMQMISSFLPLTIANNLLIGLIVKGIPLMEMSLEIGLLLGITLVVIVIVFVKKNAL